MQRREFLTKAGAGAALAAVAGTAHAQQQPVRWRMASMWPKSLDAMQGSAETFARRVGQITEGRFEIALARRGRDRAARRRCSTRCRTAPSRCGHVLSSFFFGKNPAIAFDAGMPFGLNTRQQFAWMFDGGGLRADARRVQAVQHRADPGGQRRRADGRLVSGRRSSRSPTSRASSSASAASAAPSSPSSARCRSRSRPATSTPSLEKGTIDAAEWIGPYDDEKLGLHKVAKYYYTPGWWEGSAQVTLLVNQKAWEALPQALPGRGRAARRASSACCMIAKYDAKNPEALRRLVAAARSCASSRARCSMPATRRPGGVRRVCGEERGFQEDVRVLAEVPRRGEPLVPRRRARARQLPVRRTRLGTRKASSRRRGADRDFVFEDEDGQTTARASAHAFTARRTRATCTAAGSSCRT